MSIYRNLKDFSLTAQKLAGKHTFLKCSNIVVSECIIRDGSIFFIECDGIKVRNCSFHNTNSIHSLQCNKSRNIYVGFNYFEEQIGKSRAADIINMYKSNKALIEHNYVRGGGPHQSGGGIILGDNMGDDQKAINNTVIDCGQYGMAIAGGRNNQLLNNTIISARHPWSNVGLYVWGIPQRKSVVTAPIVKGNAISWVNREGRNNSMWISTENVHEPIVLNNKINLPYRSLEIPHGVGAGFDKMSPRHTKRSRRKMSENKYHK